MKTTLYIIRHAEASGNIDRVFHGWTDSEITQKGQLQAMRIADKMSKYKLDTIYSSPLKRTFQTAEYIAKKLELNISLCDGLREINGGDWENISWSMIRYKWPKEFEIWENSPHELVIPNGENMKTFQERSIKAVEKIINENLGKNICLLTHGTFIKSILCYFRNMDLSHMKNLSWHENTSLTVVEKSMNAYRILQEGNFDHLDQEHATLTNQDWWKNLYKL